MGEVLTLVSERPRTSHFMMVAPKTALFLTIVSGVARGYVHKFSPFMKFCYRAVKIELRPPTRADFPKAISELKAHRQNAINGRFMDLTIPDILANTAVAIEVLCWFFVGEIIGRGELT